MAAIQQLIIVTKNLSGQVDKLPISSNAMRLKLNEPISVAVIDTKTGKLPADIIYKRKGQDLVIELKNGEYLEIENFYSENVAIYDNESFSGAPVDVTPITSDTTIDTTVNQSSSVDTASASPTSGKSYAIPILGGLGFAAAVAANSGGGGSSKPTIAEPDPVFKIFRQIEDDAGASRTLPFEMKVGDRLDVVRDNEGIKTGYLLNGNPPSPEFIAALEESSFYIDFEIDLSLRGPDFDTIEVLQDGTYLIGNAGRFVQFDFKSGSIIGTFPLYDKGQLFPEVTGSLFVEADRAKVEFSAANDSQDAYSGLEEISVITSSESSLFLSNNGASDFMPDLLNIRVESTATPALGSPSGPFIVPKARLGISASADFNNSLFGSGFMDKLETITIIGSNANVSMSISHSGGVNFMPSLQTIEVKANGGRFNAELDISASVNRGDDIDGNSVLLTNDYFMSGLQSIEVISELGQASMSMSNSGGNYFMDSLTSILVQGNTNAKVSISASANIRASREDSFNLRGDYFMQSLESIEVVSNTGKVSLSLSNSGGAYFMQSLTSIDLKLLGEGDRIEFSLSASANQDNYSSEDIPLKSDYFMPALETITISSTSANISFSLSHSGGAYFMQSLRSVNLSSLSTINGSVRFEISASANFRLEQLNGDFFMQSLETINLESASDYADLSISHSGGKEFMTSLTSIHVEGSLDSHISINASLNYDGATGANFMSDLQTITLIGNGLDVLSNYDEARDRASLEITNEGINAFMASLKTISVTGSNTSEAIVTIENEVSNNKALNGTDDMNLKGDNFMSALTSIEALAGDDANYAVVDIYNQDGNAFMPLLQNITVKADNAFVRLEGRSGKDGGSINIDLTDVGGSAQSLAFMLTNNLTFDTQVAPTSIVTMIGSSNFQYNALYEVLSPSEENQKLFTPDENNEGDGNILDGEFRFRLDLSLPGNEFVTTNQNPYLNTVQNGAVNASNEPTAYGGFISVWDEPSQFVLAENNLPDGETGWIDVGGNGVKDIFKFTSIDIGTIVIGGFDAGMDVFDFSSITSGNVFSASSQINDQSDSIINHIATDLGNLLVTSSDTSINDAILWLNTDGGTTTDFDDFEAFIYVVGGASLTWDQSSFDFVA